MLSNAKLALLWISSIGCGVIAGVYFIFSVTVMPSLGRTDASSAVRVMNIITVEILRSPFLPLFVATSLAAAGLAIIAIVGWGQAGSSFMLAGSIVYLVGMLGVTMAFNIPLNDMLAAVSPTSDTAGASWAQFLKPWQFWNHVRGLASVCASVLFTAALAAR